MDDTFYYFESERVITEIIEILYHQEENKISSKTFNEYLKIFQRLESKNYSDFYEGSKRYFYKKKAAITHNIYKILESCITEMSPIDLDEETLKQLIEKADHYISIYYEYCENKGVSPVKKKPPTKNSKRRSISRMGDYWREQIWNECKNPDFKGAVALLDQVGARPCELEKGALVEWQENSSYLFITLKGGKVGEEGKNGQKIRKLKIDLSTGCYRGSPKEYLMNSCFEYGYCKIKVHPKRLNDYVRRISEKLWPQKKNHITPYSYRHQTSADIKKDGFSKEKTAMAMGHRSTRSQKHYGTARQGGRRSSVVGVECSDPVRSHEQDYNSNLFNRKENNKEKVRGR
jgi:integrase